MKVLPLRELKSYWAMQGFLRLMLGMKMLPSYAGESFEAFYERAWGMPPEDQETLIREAVAFVPLDKDEAGIMLSFTTDVNGISITEHNIKHLGPDDIMERIVAVCCELAKIRVNLVSDSEKKKSLGSQST